MLITSMQQILAKAGREEALDLLIIEPTALFDQCTRQCGESAKLLVRRRAASTYRIDIRGIETCLQSESGVERDRPGAGVGHGIGKEHRLNLRFRKAAAVNLVEYADKALDEHRRCRHGTRQIRDHSEPGLHVTQCRFGGFGGGVERVDRKTFHENCLSLVFRELEFPCAIYAAKATSNEFDEGYLATLGQKASPKSPHSTPSVSQMGRQS